jgi:hypothetical protein
MGPSACEVYHKEASLPRLLVRVPAFYFFWKGVDGVLRHENAPVEPLIRLVEEISHAVLLAHLMLVRRVGLVVCAYCVEEFDAALMASGDEGAGIELEA